MTPTLKAGLWMIAAVCSFSAMAVAGREISAQLDTFEIMMYRSMIGVILVLLGASAFGTLREISTTSFPLHIYRNVAHFAGQNLWFYCMTLMPLAQLFAFEFSVPIWVMLAAPLMLGERLNTLRVLSILFGFIGILIVTQPWSTNFGVGVIPALLCTVGFAGSALFTKQLTNRVTITCIMFWMTVMQLLFGIICAGYDGDIAPLSGPAWGWIFVVGLGGLSAHFCLTSALSLAPATVVTPIDFTRLPVIALVGYVLYNEPVELAVIIGAVVIFTSNYIIIWKSKNV
ncbi:DMT transporter permease [Amylibacter marinus]|uniref:DMT transporter permease n=1 Tax=Amylibacter marinus TaxID=1475483 RepID=A0ABQ5VTM6_9RHOB|nr:DMT family transporter [Amylibacter marinus]GLQ34468.1 DMT transporter permease [Amylibacter marinus]